MEWSDWLWVVILGVVQGITEFLPISSDGHLTLLQGIAQRWTGASQPPGAALELVLALHVGTLVSLLVIYRRDLWELPKHPRLCGIIILATIPVGLFGLCFKSYFESTFDSPFLAGLGLLITAAALWVGQFSEQPADTESLATRQPTWAQALWIGMCQVLALFPGISRSGTTIAAGMTSGLDRRTAARFSFLIAIPAVGGATLLLVKDLWEQGGSRHPWPLLLLGAVTSAVVGYGALQWLLRLVVLRRLYWFAYYCLVLGLVTLTWQTAYPAMMLTAR